VVQSTTPDLGRRNLLRGRIGQALPNQILPPWAVSDFLDRCSRCLDCLNACPQAIILKGEGGFPQVDFGLGGCDFCGDCVAVCTSQALNKSLSKARPWRHKAAIGGQCLDARGISCRICGDACTTRAIRFRPQLGGRVAIELDRAFCTGCGGCVGSCPAGAITLTISDKTAERAA
jgi:ferredoxin-type protein NapF